MKNCWSFWMQQEFHRNFAFVVVQQAACQPLLGCISSTVVGLESLRLAAFRAPVFQMRVPLGNNLTTLWSCCIQCELLGSRNSFCCRFFVSWTTRWVFKIVIMCRFGGRAEGKRINMEEGNKNMSTHIYPGSNSSTSQSLLLGIESQREILDRITGNGIPVKKIRWNSKEVVFPWTNSLCFPIVKERSCWFYTLLKAKGT